MDDPAHIQRIDAALRSTRQLEEAGVSARRLAALLAAGEIIRVTRGWYVSAQLWRSWYPSERHLAAVLAVHRSAKVPPVFSHHSAAAILGLPLWGLRTEAVHCVSSSCSGTQHGVMRHKVDSPLEGAEDFAGLRCTGPDQTLIDLARVADLAMLVGAADAVLRLAAGGGRRPDPAKVNAWRDRMREVANISRGMRGVRQLRRTIELADARADSPLESVSRLHLNRLGFAYELQVRVPGQGSGYYDIDFELVGLGIFGEADGDQKYLDEAMLGGKSTAQAVLREKKRDNWISGQTGYRMIHWGAAACRSTESFAAMLRDFKVPLPRRPRHL